MAMQGCMAMRPHGFFFGVLLSQRRQTILKTTINIDHNFELTMNKLLSGVDRQFSSCDCAFKIVERKFLRYFVVEDALSTSLFERMPHQE